MLCMVYDMKRQFIQANTGKLLSEVMGRRLQMILAYCLYIDV